MRLGDMSYTVNVEIFDQTKFRLVSSSSPNVNFRLYKIRLWAWSVILNGQDADVNVHMSTCCQCQNNV